MSETSDHRPTKFEVEIHPIQKRDIGPCDHYHYKARWAGRQYVADNIICHISACPGGDTRYESSEPYENTFRCHSRTLDACICEAEYILKDCLFGKAELFDGKYRVATVMKRYDDDYTNSSLTGYGKKCHKSEHKDEYHC